MVRKCVVWYCASSATKTPGVPLHLIPKSVERRKIWVDAISKNTGREFCLKENALAYVCEKHFLTDDYKSGCLVKVLHPSAVPSVFPGGLPTLTLPDTHETLTATLPSNKLPLSPIVSCPETDDLMTDIEFDIDENGEFREYQVVYNPVSSITSPQNSIHNHPEGDERYLKLLEQYNRVVEDRNKIMEDHNKIVEERNIIEENNKRLVKSHDKLLKSRNRLKVKYHRLQKKMKRASKNAIVDIFTRGRQSRRYSSEIRSFALTQSFLSQRSYTSLREKSGKQLPHPRTIRKWYRAVTTEPGLSVAAIRAINLKVEEDRKNGKETTSYSESQIKLK
ncbi:THAP-type domain-containing protein [Sergentomyia squamirostris]